MYKFFHTAIICIAVLAAMSIFAIYAPVDFWSRFWIWAFIAASTVFPVAMVLVSRRMARSRIVMNVYDDGTVKMVKCPDCSGGVQLMGGKIPDHLLMDGGKDEQGHFFRPRQANVNTCNTCHGLTRIPKRIA